VVKSGVKKVVVLQKLGHVACLPHKAAGWIFDGKRDTFFDAEATQTLSAFIELIGLGNFGCMQSSEAR
jgi:hypothetical protein